MPVLKFAIVGLAAITHILRAFRVPIVAAAAVGFFLCWPPQIIEIYRALAQELLFADTSRFMPLLELASSAVLFAACIASIWLTAGAIERLGHAGAQFAKLVSAHLAKFLAAVPVACLAIGLYRSASETGAPPADPAVLRSLSHIFEETEPLVLESIKTRMLGYNWYLDFAAITIALATALVLFLPPALARWWPVRWRPARATFAARLRPGELFSRRVRFACYAVAIALVLATVLSRVTLPQIMGTLGALFAFVAVVTPILAYIATLSDRHGVPYLIILAAAVFAISWFDLNDGHMLYRHTAAVPSSAPSSSALPNSAPQSSAAQTPAVQGAAAPGADPCPALSGGAVPLVEEAFCHWWQKRPDKDRFGKDQRYPVYVVAAEGGGIYAALHAASVLGGLQDRCPAFADHLFAISSVSGGSLGAATFAAGLKYAQEAGWPSATNDGACRETDPPQGRVRSMVEFADSLLTKDLFSPLAAGLMFPDMLQGLLPWPVGALDRTRNFEEAFETALDRTIAEMEAGDGYRGKVENFFRTPVLRHWTPSARTPALVMNTTEVGSGRIRVIAPFVFNPDHVLFLPFGDSKLEAEVGQRLDDLPVSVAAITTARFPWVTPAGAFYDWSSAPASGDGDERETEKIRLVDGGYFENSGVATAMEMITSMRLAAWQYNFADKVKFRLIVLTKGGFARQEFFGLSELISPVVALLSTRTSRAPLIIDQLERKLVIDVLERSRRYPDLPMEDPDLVVSKVRLQDLYYPLPLGWRLSAVSSILIQAQNGMPDRCTAGGIPQFGDTLVFDADCVVKDVKDELKPVPAPQGP
jgi:hypothetical protein